MPRSKESNSRILVSRGDESSDMNSAMRKHDHKSPIFTGSFNGWEDPARMIRVKDFSHFIDKRKTEFILSLKRRGLIHKDV